MYSWKCCIHTVLLGALKLPQRDDKPLFQYRNIFVNMRSSVASRFVNPEPCTLVSAAYILLSSVLCLRPVCRWMRCRRSWGEGGCKCAAELASPRDAMPGAWFYRRRRCIGVGPFPSRKPGIEEVKTGAVANEIAAACFIGASCTVLSPKYYQVGHSSEDRAAVEIWFQQEAHDNCLHDRSTLQSTYPFNRPRCLHGVDH